MASCDHDHQDPSAGSIAAAIGLAKARCEAAGQRWTPQRERALTLLLEAGGLVKAYDLLKDFEPGGVTAPPTVYRALDTLVAIGAAHKVASMNAYVACSLTAQDHIASFLICDCCARAEEIATPMAGLVRQLSSERGFTASQVTLEARGRCADCQT